MKRLLAIGSALLLIVFAGAEFTSARIASVPSGAWMAAPGPLAQARSGAASVRLYDGRVLVIGGYGDGAGGPMALAAVEAFGASGVFATVAPMTVPRAHATATLLYDGTVLVTGGTTVGGTATATAELYDPFTDTWSLVAPMGEARTRHTATLLVDGRVLVAGGASVEVYEPWYGTFSFGGVLTPPRTDHAATLVADGRVLMAGGRSPDGPVANVDAFQDGVGVTTIGALSVPRTLASATALLDGRVLVAGGRTTAGDVGTLEIIDPSTGATVVAGSLRTPRSGHVAFLLPDNNMVLIAGGTSGDVPLASAELYVPWTGDVLATGAFDHARAETTGALLDPPGALLVAGGWTGQAYDASAELYGFATVHTTKGDYAPGEIVPITGAGWQPGETVTLLLSEVPDIHADRTMTVVADAQGRIANSDFSPEAHDVGVRFYLTATGAVSQAQVTFTDGSATVTGVVRSSGSGNPVIAGATVTCSSGCNGTPSTTSAADGSYSLPVNFSGSSATIQLTASRTGFTSATSTGISVSNSNSPTYNFFLAPTDTVPPTVSSITRGGSSPTTASSVTWSVTFSESVNGVDATDFALAVSGLSGTSITSVTGGPVTYTVTASTGTGTGTIGLNLVDNDSITDTAGNKLGGTGAGNGSFTGQVYTVDRTAPTVTATPSRAADHNGWYNAAVTITFASTDGDVASCDPAVVYAAPESATASVSGSCTDTAGNVGHATFSFKYDGTGPTATLGVTSGTPGAHGWYTSDVTVHTSGTDAVSGIESCTADQSQATETTGTAFNGSCTNNAGLTTAADAVTIKVDKTAPTGVTLTPSGTPGLAGWYVSDVAIATTGSETISGPVVCTDVQHQTTDTTGTAFNGSCTNDAGLTASASELTVKRDATPPAVTATPSRPTDYNGWFNHAVTIGFSGTDATSGVAQCAPDVSYSAPDTESASAEGTCTDAAGNVGHGSYAFKFDATPPTAAQGVTAGTAGAHGWYTSDVTIHTSGADSTSGIERCTADQSQAAETAGVTFHGSCTNGAGLTTDAADLAIKLDKTGPSASLAIAAGTAGAHGWYVSDVTLEASGTDSISAPVTCSDAQHQTTDTAGAVFNASCTNDAGLTTSASPVTVKLDKTPPVVTAAASRAADHDGWYNHGLSVAFSATDATSGVDSCDADVAYAGPDSATASASGSCKDNAGNSATGTLSFEYDATAPVGVTGALGRGADHSGWFNHPVDVTFSGTDPVSGIASCSTVAYAGPDNAAASASGSCTDHAGNTSSTASTTFKYDATAPTGVAASADRAADHNGWFNHAVAVTWSGTDATSGIAACTTTSYSAPDNGAASLNGSCTDVAGNSSADVTFGFKFDATPPTANGTPARGADHNGWFNHAVAIAFSGTDATSGVAGCSADVNYSTPDSAGATADGTCTDNAGNVGHGTYSFKYDGSAPTANLAVTSGTAGTHGWYTSDVVLHTSGVDAVSDIESCTADQSQTAETTGATFHGTCVNGAGLSTDAAPITVKVDKTGPTATLAITGGTVGAHGWYVSDVTLETSGADTISAPVTCTAPQHQTTDTAGAAFNASCTNDAGLVTTASPLTVRVDKTPPVVTAAAARGPDHDGWYNHAVSIAFTATDAMSGVDSCDPDAAYAGPDSATASASGSCKDNAGNSATGTLSFQYDATAPAGVTGALARGADHNGWYNHAVDVSFSGTDPVSGIANCSTVAYAGPDTATASASGTCTDRAGNTSAAAHADFKYDATAPTGVAASADRAADHNGWFNHALAVTWTGTDATSGVAACTTTNYSAPDNGAASLNGSCTDVAGNTSADVAFGFKFDATAPGVTATPARAPDHNGWFNHAVAITFSGTDATSGVAACSADLNYSAPDSATASADGTCTDNAGNVGHGTHTFKYDGSAPSATLAVSSGTPGAHGWYTSDVVLHTSGADTVSDIESCTADQSQAAETTGATFHGTCVNGAGLSTDAAPVTVKMDKTGPTATLAITGGTPGAHGWYVSDVTLEATGADSISAPVSCTDPQHLIADSGGTSFNASCTNDAGLTTAATPMTVKLDKTPPTVTAAPSRAADHDGWYNKPVGVTFTATDATSGVAGCAPDVAYNGPDAASVSIPGTCTDNAGNVGNASLAFQYDATPPASVTGALARGADHSGWFNHPVDVTFSGTDPVSGIATCSTLTYSGPDNAAASASGTCTDHAGNASAPATTTFKYDATAPTGVAAAADRAADHNGWFNHAMAVTWSGTDATSGIATCTTSNYSTPDTASGSLNGACTDNAGNTSADVPFAFKYDATAPDVVGTPARTADHNGWFNHAVAIGFSGTDATSGVAGCSADVTYSAPDSAAAAADGSCTDNAGNVGHGTAAFKYDGTAPTATLAASGSEGAHGWFVGDVVLHASGDDSVSGIESCTADQSQATETTGATFHASCTNGAGLGTDATPVTVKVDKTGPTANLAITGGTPGAHGWYVSDVTLETTGADTISAPVTCTAAQHQATDTPGAVFTGSCTNDAGLTTDATAVTVKLDTTPPVVTATANRPADHDGWYNHPFVIGISATDATSGVDTCGPDVTYSGPDAASSSVSGACTDNAGNHATATLAFQYDATAPVGVSVAADRAADHNGWFNHPVALTWSGTDATSGIAACTTTSYAGPDNGTASLSGSCTDAAGNTSGSVPFAFKYDATAPTAALAVSAGTPGAHGWYVSDVTLHTSGAAAVSGIESCTTDQSQTTETTGATFNGSCTSGAGLTTNAAPLTVKLDKTAPSGVALAANGTTGKNGWFIGDVTVHASGGDSISTPVTCTADQSQKNDTPGTVFHGSCTNDAGLTSNAADITVKRDATPPVLAPAVSPSPVVLNGTATAQSNATDATSGIASASCVTPATGIVGSKTTSCTATDNAGNVTTNASVGYSVIYALDTAVCLGSPAHQVLQPVNANGSSVFKQKSTVPVKFRACDANGVSISAAGVVSGFAITGVMQGNTALQVTEDLASTTPDSAFRWSPTDQLWIFNVDTKGLTSGRTYTFGIQLNDTTLIPFQFTLK